MDYAIKHIACSNNNRIAPGRDRARSGEHGARSGPGSDLLSAMSNVEVAAVEAQAQPFPRHAPTKQLAHILGYVIHIHLRVCLCV